MVYKLKGMLFTLEMRVLATIIHLSEIIVIVIGLNIMTQLFGHGTTNHVYFEIVLAVPMHLKIHGLGKQKMMQVLVHTC